MTYMYSGDERELEGAFDMKRANDTAVFTYMLPVRRRGGSDGMLLIRPDLEKSYFTMDYPGLESRYSSLNVAPRLSGYKYDGEVKCGFRSDLECYSFVHMESILSRRIVARMNFLKEDMSLVSEVFFPTTEENITFDYYSVEDYIHLRLDDTFSRTDFDRDAATPAPYALSSGCPGRVYPTFPHERFCSMQGSGWIWYSHENYIEGAFDMKRVNNTAMFKYLIPVRQETGGIVLVRPDLGNSYFTVNAPGVEYHAVSFVLPLLSEYTFIGDIECGRNYDLNCSAFAYEDPQDKRIIAQMNLLKENMTLIGEVFYPSEEESISFDYISFEDFEHNEIDDAFSSDAFPETSSNAPWALSSACKQPDPPTPPTTGSSSSSSSSSTSPIPPPPAPTTSSSSSSSSTSSDPTPTPPTPPQSLVSSATVLVPSFVAIAIALALL